MTSILTNTNAMAALSTLRSISSGMEETQARISSGLRVGSASDNAAYWSIATTMRSDNMALSSVSDALGLGAAKVDTAYAGMESAIEVVKEIKAKLVAATEDGVDKAKIQEEITQLKDQLTAIASAASFSGENWLQADLTGNGGPITKNVVASFVRDDEGNVSVKKANYTLNTSTVLFDETGNTGILDKMYDVSQASVTLSINTNGTVADHRVAAYSIDFLIDNNAQFQGNYAIAGGQSYVQVEGTWVEAVAAGTTGREIAAVTTAAAPFVAESWVVDTTSAPATAVATQSIATLNINGMDNDTLDVMISAVDAALNDMTSAAANLGSIGMRIDMQGEFVKKLSESIDKGIGRLVDADMNEESTRLKALQTQQQLAIQALSIANSDSQSVLSLFR